MSPPVGAPRYPGYNVLEKRHTPSWNEKTRLVVDKRLAVPVEPRFFNEAEWQTLCAVCARILPQPGDRPPVPLPAYIDQKLLENIGEGYQYLPLPDDRSAWRRGLKGLDATAQAKYGTHFHHLSAGEQDLLLRAMQKGELKDDEFATMPSNLFFAKRLLFDITSAYYAHPTAWSEIGFGGPAHPRGYVRMEISERDPWEAVEVGDDPARTIRENRRVR